MLMELVKKVGGTMRLNQVGLSILLVITFWVLVALILSIVPNTSADADAFAERISSLSTSTHINTPIHTPVAAVQVGSDSTAIPVAWIAFTGVVVASLIAALIGSFAVAIYQ